MRQNIVTCLKCGESACRPSDATFDQDQTAEFKFNFKFRIAQGHCLQINFWQKVSTLLQGKAGILGFLLLSDPDEKPVRGIRRGIRRTPRSCVLVGGSFTSISQDDGWLAERMLLFLGSYLALFIALTTYNPSSSACPMQVRAI